MNNFERKLLFANIFLWLFLTIFSYAYVDLNLTLTTIPALVNAVSFLQNLGYFHRQLATFIYLIFILVAFLFFIFNLFLFYKQKIGISYLRSATIINTLILMISYPFLSYDLFNYLFDAKIILNYHSNPYIHRPLDFADDEWIRFMRWVHRYSPYGPLWLIMSVIPAVLGFGKFLLNFLAFKVFIGLFHLINAYLIFKILTKINPKSAIFGAASYALNPLFLIEGVVNAHNDVVLATFMLAVFYSLLGKRIVLAHVVLILGVLIKYIPLLNWPWLIWITFNRKQSIKRLIYLNLVTMIAFTFIFSSFRISVPFVSSGATQTQFQPWYLFWTVPLVVLINNYKLFVIAVVLCFGASLRYLPYLYFGDWNWIYTTKYMTVVSIILPIVVILLLFIRKSLFFYYEKKSKNNFS